MKKSTRALAATLFCLLALLLCSAGAGAADIPFITTADLKAKMDAGEQLVLANALSPIEHDDLSIKGSVNIPSALVAGHENMPTDKGTLLIFYCLGPKCGKSLIAAQKAVKLGYTNVMVYNEGLPAWARNKYPLERTVEYPQIEVVRLTPQQVFDMKDGVVILDIRGAKHQELGRIANATEIVFDHLKTKYSSLPKGKKIVVVDHAAKQVVIAAKFLYMQGYTDVAVMDGGVTTWLRNGLPVLK